MGAWKMSVTERKFLLPVIITVSLFLALPGMRAPSHAKPSNGKPSPRNVVEIQVKETEESIGKVCQVVEFNNNPHSFAPTLFYVEAFRHEACNSPPVLMEVTTARAPPPVNS
jgi:hypothetical protein